MELKDAIIHKQTWKSPQLDAYVRALLMEARRLLLFKRIAYFNNDDVPDTFQPGDKTTVGTAFKLLVMEGIIEAYRENIPPDIWGGMRRSTRPCNNGHRNQLYRIASMAKLDTWLARHGASRDVLQQELMFTKEVLFK